MIHKDSIILASNKSSSVVNINLSVLSSDKSGLYEKKIDNLFNRIPNIEEKDKRSINHVGNTSE